ncbi:MAG: Asp23/Gls24 family envelope stress response protein [Parasporobacterium sp.]|nr:Asp23/Gls24 family envelope stress response protein [Parasporobacterium sp.]
MDEKTYEIYEEEGIGSVKVTDEVIAIIAGLAATEVEGVDSMAGNITNEIVSKLGWKNLSAGVRISCIDGNVSVFLSLVMKMGYNIPKVSKEVQEKVKSAIENMTELKVLTVDIRIANVRVEE